MSNRNQIENSQTIETSGTCLQGYVETTLDELIAAFGEPTFQTDDDHEKVQIEFCLRINGVIATVYTWKTYGDPTGETTFHVGGSSKASVEAVQSILS